jgi:hypothetical protein
MKFKKGHQLDFLSEVFGEVGRDLEILATDRTGILD